MIRVLICDDHMIVRQGIRQSLAEVADIEVVDDVALRIKESIRLVLLTKQLSQKLWRSLFPNTLLTILLLILESRQTLQSTVSLLLLRSKINRSRMF